MADPDADEFQGPKAWEFPLSELVQLYMKKCKLSKGATLGQTIRKSFCSPLTDRIPGWVSKEKAPGVVTTTRVLWFFNYPMLSSSTFFPKIKMALFVGVYLNNTEELIQKGLIEFISKD